MKNLSEFQFALLKEMRAKGCSFTVIANSKQFSNFTHKQLSTIFRAYKVKEQKRRYNTFYHAVRTIEQAGGHMTYKAADRLAKLAKEAEYLGLEAPCATPKLG